MATTLFAAIDRLVELARADATLAAEDALVLDGGPRTETARTMLCIGWSPDLSAGEGQQRKQPGLRAVKREEEYDVWCALASVDADADSAKARAKAQRMYAAVEALVLGDPTLGGAVSHAVMGTSLVFGQVQMPGGAAVTLEFSITCKAIC